MIWRQNVVTTKTDSDTLAYSEIGDIICNKATAMTITLPTPSSGAWYRIGSINTGVVSIVYDGTTLAQINNEEQCFVNTDGFNWYTFFSGGEDEFHQDQITLYVGYNKMLTGRISTVKDSTTITGVNTLFNTELTVGDYILIGTDLFAGRVRIIDSITSNTSLEITEAATSTLNNQYIQVFRSGDDNNTGNTLSASGALATVQEALNRLKPCFPNNNSFIYIMPGIYDEYATIENFFGAGTLSVQCYFNPGQAYYPKIKGMDVYNCGIKIIVERLNIELSDTYSLISNAQNVFFRYVVTEEEFAGVGFYADSNSNLFLYSCTISNKEKAILAEYNARIVVESCSGEGNEYKYHCTAGSAIVEASNDIDIEGEDYTESGGLIVYSNGSIKPTFEFEGINKTITVGVDKDFQTIQAAINSVKKHIKLDVYINIEIDDGTYEENLVVEGFSGGGELWIYSASGDASSCIIGGDARAKGGEVLFNENSLINLGAWSLTINYLACSCNTTPCVYFEDFRFMSYTDASNTPISVNYSSIEIEGVHILDNCDLVAFAQTGKIKIGGISYAEEKSADKMFRATAGSLIIRTDEGNIPVNDFMYDLETGSCVVESNNSISDPGDAEALPSYRSGVCNIVSEGIETRTLAVPEAVGLRLALCFKTDGGDVTITVASAINQNGDNTILLNSAGDFIELVAVMIGANLAWRVVINDGCTLSTI